MHSLLSLHVFRVVPILLPAALALLLPGLAAGRVQVVATLPSLAALARDVGGELVAVESLAVPRQDPHFVDPRPDLVLKLGAADLLLENGLDLEVGWLPALVRGARNPKLNPGASGRLNASTLVRLLEVPAGPIDRSQGDVHPGGNPHFLYDPRAAAQVGKGIAERLAAIDPEHAGAYRERAAALAGRLEALAATQRARVQALPAARRQVVVYHRSFAYLVDWLGLEVVAEVEPKPGIAPDPAHVAAVLSRMRQTGVKAILAEDFYPTRTSETLAQLAGAKLAQLPAAARFEAGQTTEEFLRAMSDEVLRALGG